MPVLMGCDRGSVLATTHYSFTRGEIGVESSTLTTEALFNSAAKPPAPVKPIHTKAMSMEFLEPLELGLEVIVRLLTFILESISAFCVLAGLMVTGRLAITLLRRRGYPFPFSQLRLQFGTWLALALEFQLGADVLSTTIAPSLEALAQLAVIAVIRTFLNYFLNKELQAEEALRRND